MCDFTQGIKFCTCPNEVMNSKDISSWTLKRYFGQDWMDLETGRCSITAYESDEQAGAELIWLRLNTRNCFDFDYQPVAGDVLNIETAASKGKISKYEFTFEDNQWRLTESISDHLNMNLIIHEGYLDNDTL